MGVVAADPLTDAEPLIGGTTRLGDPHDDYPGLWEMYAESLRGPRGGIVKATLIKGGFFYAFGVYCAVQAVLSTDVRSVVLWSLGVVWSIAVVITAKLWWWMEMNRKSMLRCMERVAARHNSK
jgi:hypothetical protein